MPLLEALATIWIEDLVDNGQPDPICHCPECTLALVRETAAIMTYRLRTGRYRVNGTENDSPGW
ncbi:MAG: hypothetical protein JWM18_3691 [Chloroflexi bacterium]|jgi:hypothetical protein|nr:hypothetical protein [Chloroflexota bacterium]